jgi:hypothetical protein
LWSKTHENKSERLGTEQFMGEMYRRRAEQQPRAQYPPVLIYNVKRRGLSSD